MNSDKPNNLILKYIRCLLLGFQDVGDRKIEFVAKSQILYEGMCEETITKHFPLIKLAHEKGKAVIKFERTLQISILKKTSELKR